MRLVLIAYTVACLLVSGLANADTVLYGGLGGHQNGDSTNDGALGIVDQTTGVVNVVGHPAGVARISGLTFDLNGNLYGATQGSAPFPPVPPPSASALILINPAHGSLISDIGTITNKGIGINISDLALDPLTGALFGIRGPNDGNNGQGLLYNINKTTGIATLVGDTHSFFGSIAFGPDGTLYLSAADLDFTTGNTINARLETLNPSDATVNNTVFTSEFYGALGVRPTDAAIFAGNGDQHTLFTLNATTGAETTIGDTGRNFIGDLAFTPIPEPAEFIPLAIVAGAICLMNWRRKRSDRI